MIFLKKIIKQIEFFIISILILCIDVYKILISPILKGGCRYQPTCSTYARQALQKYGPIKGTYLGIKRILTCHPWGNRDIIDPVS